MIGRDAMVRHRSAIGPDALTYGPPVIEQDCGFVVRGQMHPAAGITRYARRDISDLSGLFRCLGVTIQV